MIFTSESALTDPSRIAAWDLWYRGIAVFPDLASARGAAAGIGGMAALYAPMTETFLGARSG